MWNYREGKLQQVKEGGCQSTAVSAGEKSGNYGRTQAFSDDLEN